MLTLERNTIASNQSVFQATAALTADREVRACHRPPGSRCAVRQKQEMLFCRSSAAVICNKGYHSFITYVVVTEEPQRSGLPATGRSERREPDELSAAAGAPSRAEPSRAACHTGTPLRSFDSEVRAGRGHAQTAAPCQTHHITSMARKTQISKHEHTFQQHMTTSRQIRAKKGI